MKASVFSVQEWNIINICKISTILPGFTSQQSVVFSPSDELAREGAAHHFVGPEPAVGVSRQCIRRKIQCWLDRQHLVRWRGLAGTMRQAQELISGPHIAAKTALMSFNRAQSRVVTGLLTGHNTLRRHLHIMGLHIIIPRVGNVGLGRIPRPMCCVSVKPWRHSGISIWDTFSWTLRTLEVWVLRAIWNFLRRTGLSWLGPSEGAQRPCQGLRAAGP
jgi:hypothetical protein